MRRSLKKIIFQMNKEKNIAHDSIKSPADSPLYCYCAGHRVNIYVSKQKKFRANLKECFRILLVRKILSANHF